MSGSRAKVQTVTERSGWLNRHDEGRRWTKVFVVSCPLGALQGEVFARQKTTLRISLASLHCACNDGHMGSTAAIVARPSRRIGNGCAPFAPPLARPETAVLILFCFWLWYVCDTPCSRVFAACFAASSCPHRRRLRGQTWQGEPTHQSIATACLVTAQTVTAGNHVLHLYIHSFYRWMPRFCLLVLMRIWGSNPHLF